MAILRAKLRGLEHLLDLPEEVRITDVRMSDDSDDTAYLNLEGPGLSDGFLEAVYAQDENGGIHLMELRTVE